MHPTDQRTWWQTRWFVVLASLAATVPLLWPDIPPLFDLPGHMGRYRMQLEGGRHPWLGGWYDFRWSLIGNLGYDLLIVPLAPLVGLEGAVKLITLCVPALTVLGLLWIAREVHGRIPATALFALPLAYSYPFQFGFANFALSMALALCLFALWLRMGRLSQVRWRAALFVPLSCLLWVVHTFGWGVLGVLAFSAELIRHHDLTRGERGWVRRWFWPWVRAGFSCLPLAPPVLMMVLWRSGAHVTGKTGDWFNWRAKFSYITMVLRDRWIWFDIGSATVMYLILFRSVRDERLELSRNLLLSALFLLLVYLLLPRIVFGSAYADMRLAPFVLAVALIAIRPRRGLSPRGTATFAALGLAFFAARLVGTTWSFALYDGAYDRAVSVIDRVPVGARVVSFVERRCRDDWTYLRLEHVPALFLERRLAYTNDQWSMAGAQLLTVRYAAARGFAHDPSQVVTRDKCRGQWWRPLTVALDTFPRTAFDYVWLVPVGPVDPAFLKGLRLVASNGESALYRVVDRSPPRLPVPAAHLLVYVPRRNGVSSAR